MKKISGRIVQVNRTPIFFGADPEAAFQRVVRSFNTGRIVILTDTNTREHCLPLLLEKIPALSTSHVLEMAPGESSKSVETAVRLWSELAAAGADRTSLLVCLGGGVVTDLGGFAASTYMRGIPCVHFPTSLVGMADAAIGGKTAVNAGGLKNQAGTFYPAAAAFIDSTFLQSLPAEHLRSGLAEVIKTGLVTDPVLWKRLSGRPVRDILALDVAGTFWQEIVSAAATAKNRIVVRDFRERNLRKALNFGHTIGHALESASMAKPGSALLHGDAVAAGMISALYLSEIKAGLEPVEAVKIIRYLVAGFGTVRTELPNPGLLTGIMLHDKKTRAGEFRFSLIRRPGVPVVDVPVGAEEVGEALKFYRDFDTARS